jgi:hypothetical protein
MVAGRHRRRERAHRECRELRSADRPLDPGGAALGRARAPHGDASAFRPDAGRRRPRRRVQRRALRSGNWQLDRDGLDEHLPQRSRSAPAAVRQGPGRGRCGRIRRGRALRPGHGPLDTDGAHGRWARLRLGEPPARGSGDRHGRPRRSRRAVRARARRSAGLAAADHLRHAGAGRTADRCRGKLLPRHLRILRKQHQSAVGDQLSRAATAQRRQRAHRVRARPTPSRDGPIQPSPRSLLPASRRDRRCSPSSPTASRAPRSRSR